MSEDADQAERDHRLVWQPVWDQKAERDATFRARVASLLKRIEWNGVGVIRSAVGEPLAGCPCCNANVELQPRKFKHDSSCALAALLREVEGSA